MWFSNGFCALWWLFEALKNIQARTSSKNIQARTPRSQMMSCNEELYASLAAGRRSVLLPAWVWAHNIHCIDEYHNHMARCRGEQSAPVAAFDVCTGMRYSRPAFHLIRARIKYVSIDECALSSSCLRIGGASLLGVSLRSCCSPAVVPLQSQIKCNLIAISLQSAVCNCTGYLALFCVKVLVDCY